MVSTYNKVLLLILRTFCIPDGSLNVPSICWSSNCESGWDTNKTKSEAVFYQEKSECPGNDAAEKLAAIWVAEPGVGEMVQASQTVEASALGARYCALCYTFAFS